METQNPIKRIRDERDLAQQELAILADVSINTVRNAEKGMTSTLNEKILDALVELGYEKEKIEEGYEKWRKDLKQDIIDRKSKD
ncbi:hypothetical protein KGY79_05160 [Candidatus Bipolaricaulota bacterium]|nr:hypothetical protein [Candidatus Bipolaricaulota bacterium]